MAAAALLLAGCPNPGADADLPCPFCDASDDSGSDATVPPGTDATVLPGTDAAPTSPPPVITFVSPADGAIVSGATFDVVFTVTDADEGVDDSMIFCRAENGASVLTSILPTTQPTGEKVCTIPATTFIAGDVDFEVRAFDLGGNSTTATRMFVFDPGPVITFIAPAGADPIVTRTFAISILLDDPASVAAGTVGVTVSGLPVTNLAESVPGLWSGTFTTDDPTAPVADGPALLIASATSTNGVTGTATLTVTVDNSGPVITFNSPFADQLVGAGLVPVDVVIDDVAGVNPALVTARLDFLAPIYLLDGGAGSFIGTLDTNVLPLTQALAVVEVEAVDLLGNYSSNSVLIGIDKEPPVVELDPADLGVCDISDDTPFDAASDCGALYGLRGELSASFDPVGADAVNDLELVAYQFLVLRAWATDDSYGPPTGEQAGIDDTTTFLYVLGDTSVPLVVDVDGDGICDTINPSVAPGGAGPLYALEVFMEPLPVAGAASYPDDTDPPDPIVSWSPVTVTLEDEPNAGLPANYGVAPVVANGTEDLGQHFDALSIGGDGPVCAAMLAIDLVGNVGVSAPLRMCIELGGVSDCSGWPAGAPNCTGTMVGAFADPSMPCVGRVHPASVQETGF